MSTSRLELSLGYALPRTGLPTRPQFRQWVLAALSGAGRRFDSEVAIQLVDAAEGQAMNRQYRGKDYATNVLSFPADLPEGLPEDFDFPQLGDLVICAPVVAREAAEQGKALGDHYAHLTIHGVLHLLGFDHVEEAEAEEMEALERQILASLGIADPYAGER
ncbi:rRNA maturation RNase YbeY [Stenotrophomonas sp. W1S232]|uniref:Endoribonuclease YbeY n=1 Tax=Stenotrophomonas koreensis TaxID=266128 RepID=A0A7W3UZU8_9GAMM|nr:rRNA maturation RNase YbeY [Stenotrophomonas koreensis]